MVMFCMTHLMTSSAVALKGRPFILTMPSPPKRRASAACISLRGTCSPQSHATQLPTNLAVRAPLLACLCILPSPDQHHKSTTCTTCACNCVSAWAMQARAKHMPSNVPLEQSFYRCTMCAISSVILPRLSNTFQQAPLPRCCLTVFVSQVVCLA